MSMTINIVMNTIAISSLAEKVKKFNLIIKNLISRVEQKSRTDHDLAILDRFKRRISLLRSTMGESELMASVSEILVDYSEKILNRDAYEVFIMDANAEAEIAKYGGQIDPQDDFVNALISSIRNIYPNMTAREKDIIYNDVKSLLHCCLAYAISTR
jgi:hypothetical protein